MKATRYFLLTAVVIAVVAGFSAAQSMKGNGCGPGDGCCGIFDPKTVETLTGEVEAVETVTHPKGMSTGIHLTLKSDAETISVHLGPSWYVEKQEPKIATGDSIEITGSRITFEGKPAVIASQVKKGDEVLKLRDETGVPEWAGWRRGR